MGMSKQAIVSYEIPVVNSVGGWKVPVLGYRMEKTNRHNPIINDVNQSLVGGVSGRCTTSASEMKETNNCERDSCMNVDKVYVGEYGQSDCSMRSHTIRLEDDGRTEEVMMDLVLIHMSFEF